MITQKDIEGLFQAVNDMAELRSENKAIKKENEFYKELLTKQLILPVVSISLPSDEEIREPIQNALYSTDRLTTDQCTELADGILTYLNEAGYKVVRQ